MCIVVVWPCVLLVVCVYFCCLTVYKYSCLACVIVVALPFVFVVFGRVYLMFVNRVYCCWLAVCIFLVWPFVLLLVDRVYFCWLAVCNCLAVCFLLVDRVNFCWLVIYIVVCWMCVLLFLLVYF